MSERLSGLLNPERVQVPGLRMEYFYMPDGSVRELVEELYPTLVEYQRRYFGTNEQIEEISGIAKGGYPIFANLSDCVSLLPEFQHISFRSVIGVKLYDKPGHKMDNPEIYLWPKKRSIRGKNFLLVDDMFDSCETYLYIAGKLLNEGARSVMGFGIYVKEGHEDKINGFYLATVPENTWVIFERERIETAAAAIQEMMENGLSHSECKSGLRRIGFREKTIDKSMEEYWRPIKA